MNSSVLNLGSVMVIGDVMNDLIIRPREPVVAAADNASNISPSPGGSAANQAGWLASLGVSVDFVGCVGKADAVSHREELHRLGVRPHLIEDGRRPTGAVVAIATPDGERTFFTERGANAYLPWSEDLGALAAHTSHIHVSGHSLLDPATRRTVRRLMRAGLRQGATVSVDTGSTTHLKQVGLDRFLRYTESASLLFANRAEAIVLAGAVSPEAAADWLNSRYPEVVITLGAEGAIGTRRRHSKRRTLARARPARARVVDGTGAGDAFVAGYLVNWLRGLEVGACLRRGMSLARVALQRAGARPPAA